jgi:hypothetical protein
VFDAVLFVVGSQDVPAKLGVPAPTMLLALHSCSRETATI